MREKGDLRAFGNVAWSAAGKYCRETLGMSIVTSTICYLIFEIMHKGYREIVWNYIISVTNYITNVNTLSKICRKKIILSIYAIYSYFYFWLYIYVLRLFCGFMLTCTQTPTHIIYLYINPHVSFFYFRDKFEFLVMVKISKLSMQF